MTGREVVAAVRPVETWARAVLRLAELGHEAIRLEEENAAATRLLGETAQALLTAQADLGRTQQAAATLAGTLETQRAAAVAATEAEQLAVIGAARAVVEAHERAAAEWAAKAQAAKAAHDATVAALRAEELALREHVDGLRDLARRMARAAEAVPR